MRRNALLALLLLLPACGGAPNRPEIVATTPENEAMLHGLVQQFQIRYDEPVVILNAGYLHVYQNDAEFKMVIWVDESDPRILRARPIEGQAFGVGWVSVRVGAGTVVNGDVQYRLNDYWFGFGNGAFLPGYGAWAPPEESVVAELTSLAAGTPRRWMQFAEGGGTSSGTSSGTRSGTKAALRYLDSGVGVPTPVALSHGPGGVLRALHGALALSPDGRWLYAAYRDEADRRIRLCRVDAAAGVETDTLCLDGAAATSAAWPLGLTVTDAGRQVRVRWTADGATGTATVDTVLWQE